MERLVGALAGVLVPRSEFCELKTTDSRHPLASSPGLGRFQVQLQHVAMTSLTREQSHTSIYCRLLAHVVGVRVRGWALHSDAADFAGLSPECRGQQINNYGSTSHSRKSDTSRFG